MLSLVSPEQNILFSVFDSFHHASSPDEESLKLELSYTAKTMSPIAAVFKDAVLQADLRRVQYLFTFMTDLIGL